MKRRLSVFLAMVFLFTAVVGASMSAVYASNDEDRLGGQNRFETAYKIAKAKYTSADTVIIVRGDGPSDNPNVVDGLTASVLAGALDAPILLTEYGKLSDETKDAIKDLKPEKAYIVGGEGAVSPAVEEALEDLGLDVERVEGKDRFKTAVAVAEKAKEISGGAKTAIVTNYTALVDSLVAGPIAYVNKYPILLVFQDRVGEDTEKAIKDLGIENVIIVGGTGVVSDAVKEELEDLVSGKVTRLGGKDRIATSLEVADYLDTDDVVLVNGLSFVDAVPASVLGASILYVSTNSMEKEVKDYLATRASVKFIGGTGVISESLANEARNAIVLDVESVTPVNPTTLKIEGKGLKKLAASDITVEDNKVKSLSVAADGKSATVTLEEKLAPNVEFVVTVNVNDEEKEFKVEYVYKVTSVEIEDQVFDDDRAGQKVIFKVNGETADLDYLTLAGYTVTFVAKDSSNNAASIFEGGTAPSHTSSTGKLAASLLPGDYKVEVQVTKGGEALISDVATITVVNLDSEISAINAVTFINYGANNNPDTDYSDDLSGDDFIMNSKTLVVNETAGVYKVEATIAGENRVVPESDISISTSNPAIISVDSDKVLTAESAGTATITVKVGNYTKTYNFTVTNTDRKLSKVTVEPSSVSVVVGYTRNVTVKTFDQYGDPYAVDSLNYESTTVATISDPIATDSAGSIGQATVTITGSAAGKGTIYFKDSDGKVLASLKVTVSEKDNEGSLKWEIASNSPSKDNTLTLGNANDDTVIYQWSRYNTEGIYVEPVDLFDKGIETVEVLDFDVAGIDDAGSLVATYSVVAGTTEIKIKANQKTGKTDVLFKDADGKVVHKVTITVVKEDSIAIKAVAFKPTVTIDYAGATINYATVLDVTSSTADDIVNGITLSKSTLHKVRISETTDPGLIYLDVNGNATYDSDTDVVLGELMIDTTSDSTLTGLYTDAISGYTTASGDKGTLLFKVLTTPGDEKTAIAATHVTIDVK